MRINEMLNCKMQEAPNIAGNFAPSNRTPDFPITNSFTKTGSYEIAFYFFLPCLGLYGQSPDHHTYFGW